MKNIHLFIYLLLLAACGGSDKGETTEVSQAEGKLILDESHGGNGYAWGLPNCDSCHALGVIHSGQDKIRTIVKTKGYVTCTGCHGRNGTNESEPRRCGVCHNNIDLPQAPPLQGQHAHGFTAGEVGALGDEQCLVCHDASDMDGGFDNNRDLTRFPDAAQTLNPYNRVSDFCLRCHNRDHQQAGFEIAGGSYEDPLIAAEDDFHLIDKHGYQDGTGERSYAGLRAGYTYQSVVDCTDCHSMHATDNTALIIDRSDKGVMRLAAAIRDKPYAVNTTEGEFAQLCVLCHQMETIIDDGDLDTGNGLSGVHQASGDCQSCHSHGEAVQAGL